ncbi:endonuclease VII domain-containing protein [Salmonella enterica subsp. enterica]
MESKQCTVCGETKPRTDFYRKGRNNDVMSRCKKCDNATNPAHKLKSRYGITTKDYERMFIDQGGVCAICGSPQENRRLAVDHDHETGEVRRLLCTNCNLGLGSFKDNPQLLLNAASYLREHGRGI